tara:strand:- start:1327 stop:1827 length:501 start_codon:yes stop_codon:yes gene_type:complete
MVEVLVAVLVLAIGLLGIAGLQITSIKANHTANTHTQATQLAYDLADRMRANLAGTIAGAYLANATPNVAYNCFGDFTGVSSGAEDCSPSEMAKADLDWIFNLASNNLPFVSAAISCTSPGGLTVTVDTSAADCVQGFKHSITITWNEHDGSNGLVNKSATLDFQP